MKPLYEAISNITHSDLTSKTKKNLIKHVVRLDSDDQEQFVALSHTNAGFLPELAELLEEKGMAIQSNDLQYLEQIREEQKIFLEKYVKITNS